MTRRMADSVTVANLPEGFDLYAGYVNGLYQNYAQVVARFPGKPVVGISVTASSLQGQCLDVESGDATPQQAPQWVTGMRNLVNFPYPWVYCSEAVWPAVQQAFTSTKVDPPLYWIAAYPGPGPVLYPGSIAHQWIDHGPYDESVVADYIPGIDPAPTIQGDDMIASTPTGNGYWVCKPDGSIWSYGDAAWLGGANYPTNQFGPGVTATGFASHPTQPGYWISGSDGSVFAYGAAGYHGGPNVP